ncbi:hypothetical protein MIND_00133700 [Mycena indigotica]|uniref:Uncharacterized protein n=1 Tax=Mycena indigotica TaxID=2126181 RepID=A0A8H6TER6_9AGAR|nr:uncharacterized protein MIND_00133700 [Mycena indigotica]KAF7316155.1 hypothetical protein MIND_00133700 [Mycena indigotica]
MPPSLSIVPPPKHVVAAPLPSPPYIPVHRRAQMSQSTPPTPGQPVARVYVLLDLLRLHDSPLVKQTSEAALVKLRKHPKYRIISAEGKQKREAAAENRQKKNEAGQPEPDRVQQEGVAAAHTIGTKKGPASPGRRRLTKGRNVGSGRRKMHADAVSCRRAARPTTLA